MTNISLYPLWSSQLPCSAAPRRGKKRTKWSERKRWSIWSHRGNPKWEPKMGIWWILRWYYYLLVLKRGYLEDVGSAVPVASGYITIVIGVTSQLMGLKCYGYTVHICNLDCTPKEQARTKWGFPLPRLITGWYWMVNEHKPANDGDLIWLNGDILLCWLLCLNRSTLLVTLALRHLTLLVWYMSKKFQVKQPAFLNPEWISIYQSILLGVNRPTLLVTLQSNRWTIRHL